MLFSILRYQGKSSVLKIRNLYRKNAAITAKNTIYINMLQCFLRYLTIKSATDTVNGYRKKTIFLCFQQNINL